MSEPSRSLADRFLPSEPGLWFCTWRIFLDKKRRLEEALRPLDLRFREFWMLSLAGIGDVSQHEIAAAFGIDQSSLVAVLDGLEKRGLLRRQRNPADRRVQWVQRTGQGDRLFARALPLAQRAEAEQLAALTAAEQKRLLKIMRKLIAGSK